MGCKLLSDFEVPGCTGLGRSGVSGVVYLLAYEAWQGSARIEDSSTGEISGVTLKTGDKAVKYTLPITAPVPSTELVKNTGGKSGFKHTLVMYIPSASQTLKSELVSTVNFERLVAIVVLDSEEVANVYGSDSGLVMTSYGETPADPANGGGLMVTLSTIETGLENLPPVTFKKTDRPTTLAALEALRIVQN